MCGYASVLSSLVLIIMVQIISNGYQPLNPLHVLVNFTLMICRTNHIVITFTLFYSTIHDIIKEQSPLIEQ